MDQHGERARALSGLHHDSFLSGAPSRALRSRQRGEVRASVVLHHVAELLWREYLDVIAPKIHVPAHFKMTGGRKAHNERAVGLILGHLARVEVKASRMRGRLGAKSPNDFSELFLILEHAEGAIGEGLKIEVNIALEVILRRLRRANVFNDVEPYGT